MNRGTSSFDVSLFLGGMNVPAAKPGCESLIYLYEGNGNPYQMGNTKSSKNDEQQQGQGHVRLASKNSETETECRHS